MTSSTAVMLCRRICSYCHRTSDDLHPMKSSTDRLQARMQARTARLLDDYSLVLLLQIMAFLMITGGNSLVWRVALIPTLTAGVLATFYASNVKPRTMATVTWVVVVAGLFALVAVVADDRLISPWVLAPMVLVVLSSPAVILRRILGHRTVTAKTIVGSICVYVYLGLIFALLFGLVDSIESAPFFAQGPATRPGQFTYFSFITVTTLGYGDLSPGTDVGQGLAVLATLTGSIYMVTLVARLVSMYGLQRSVPPQGPPTSEANGEQ